MPGILPFRRLMASARGAAAPLVVAALAVLTPAVPGGAQGTQPAQPAFPPVVDEGAPLPGAAGAHGAAGAPGASGAPGVAAGAAGLAPGAAAVSGFSGSALAGDSLPPGVDPLDKTVIDVNGASLRVFDLTSLGQPPSGQLLNPPVTFEVKAKDIGQVFPLVLDDGGTGGAPALYAGATSTFGIHIVGAQPDREGHPVRLKAGTPGAKFMDGLFGGIAGATPGTIWKIDGVTGEATIFADTGAGGAPNSGPGIGGLAFDPATRSLFASDLDTGRIHRLPLDGGAADGAPFDHGQAGRAAAGLAPVIDDGARMDIASPAFKPDDPAGWGFTAAARRVNGLGVLNGRLYYAIAEGPEIWSVGITPQGFGADARRETQIQTQTPAKVTKIVFDGQGRMIVALRGTAKSPFDFGKFTDAGGGDVLRFDPAQPGAGAASAFWVSPPASFAIGSSAGARAGAGGVSLGHGYGPDGNLNPAACGDSLLATGDALGAAGSAPDALSAGLQLNAAALVRPQNDPPAQSAFLDFDGRQGDAEALGHAGDVAAFQRCGPAGGMPPVAGGGMPPVAGGGMPPVAEGGMPPVAGGGAMPPVEGGQDVQSQPNVAVTKTQNCRLVSAEQAQCDYAIATQDTGTTPFQGAGGVIEDTFSVQPETLTPPEGSQQTGAGFQMPFTPIPAGAAGGPPIQQPGLAFSATFRVPQGGLVVENCAALTFPDAGGGGGVDPQQPTARVGIVSGPACQPGNAAGTQQCTFEVLFENLGADRANANFLFTTTEPNQGVSNGSGVGSTAIDALTTLVEGPNIGPGETKSITLNLTFPANIPAPVGTATLQDDPGQPQEGQADPQQAGDGAGQGADAAAPVSDGDPADNTSCVRWDSNRPDEQGAPTNIPTEPPLPDDQQAGGDPNAPDPNAPDPNAPNLTVAKTQNCTVQGATATCQYTVTVSNPGATPFQLGAGASLEDTFSVPPQTFTVPPGATKTANGFQSTAPGPLVIDAGATNDFAFEATFPVPPGGLKVENCAAMTVPAGGQPVPAVLVPIDDVTPGQVPAPSKGFDKSVAITGEPSCVRRGDVQDCSWKVTVANTGSAPFPFGFEFSTTTANSAVVASDTLTPSRRDTFKTVFSDNATVLQPGASRTLTVQATLPVSADPASATVTTDLAVLQAADGPDINKANDSATAQAGTAPAQEAPAGVSNADGNPADNRACVTFDSNTQPPVPASLAIAKTAISPTCDKRTQENLWLCSFKVTVTNTGAAPFNDRIVLTDETNFPAQVRTRGGLTCDNPGQLSHRCEAAVNIPANGKAEFEIISALAFGAVPVNTQPGNCKLDNAITLSSPAGGAGPLTGTATAQLPVIANQGKAVPCDPPNLSLAKTAQGCTPAGGGFECRYRLTVTSIGPDRFDQGIIQIAERLPAGATIRSFPSDWLCSGSGASAECHTKAATTLEVGATMALDLTVSVPQSAVGRGQCDIANEAEIVQSGRDISKASGRYRASARAKIQSPECQPPVPAPVTCYGGMVLVSSGRCECPPGQEYNASRRSCVTPPPKVCPIGWSGDYPTCCQPGTSYTNGACLRPVVAPPPKCPPGWSGEYPRCCPPGSYSRGGRCVRPSPPPVPETPVCKGERPVGTWPNCCPENTYYERGACRKRYVEPPRCTGDRPSGTWPNCCPQGMYYERGACRRRQPQPDPTHDCAAHQRLSPDGKRCIDNCPPGTSYIRGACRRPYDDPPRCTGNRPSGTWPNCCPDGMYYERGACRRRQPQPDPTHDCAAHQRLSPDGKRCIDNCPPPTVYIRGVCRSPYVGPQPCPLPYQTRNRFGQCVGCPPGQQLDRSGRCRTPDVGPQPCPPDRPVGTPPYCCPRGTRYVRGQCRGAYDPGPGSGGGPCPPGYRRLPRPNRYGAFCEVIPTPGPTPTPTPTPGAGTRGPCPPGSIRYGRYCRRIYGGGGQPTQPTPAQQPCTGGTIRYPDGQCRCPRGLTGPGCNTQVVN